jgi:hypothetical protein
VVICLVDVVKRRRDGHGSVHGICFTKIVKNHQLLSPNELLQLQPIYSGIELAYCVIFTASYDCQMINWVLYNLISDMERSGNGGAS